MANEILPFAATDTGTNLLTQTDYAADTQRPIGNQQGIARSKLVNKVLKQTSVIAAGVGQFLSDNQANAITDTLTPAQISTYLRAVTQPATARLFVDCTLGNQTIDIKTYTDIVIHKTDSTANTVIVTDSTPLSVPIDPLSVQGESGHLYKNAGVWFREN